MENEDEIQRLKEHIKRIEAEKQALRQELIDARRVLTALTARRDNRTNPPSSVS